MLKKQSVLCLALTSLTMLGATGTLAQTCGNPLPNGNIVLDVPAQGSVSSQSTSYDCAAGETCSFTVSKSAFSETFTASPAFGYKLVGWKNDGETSLCPDETGPCVVSLGSGWTAVNSTRYLEPVFAEVGLLDLVPAETRGVFQVYPGTPGAVDTASAPTTPALAPLQLVDKYRAGMDIVPFANRLVLAQLADTPGEFLLLAELGSSDVDSVSGDAGLINQRTHQGFSIWDINTSGLQLAKINSSTLAIGSGQTLDQALDAYVGAANRLDQGPLAEYMGTLEYGDWPNSFVYGLPALYGPVPAPGSGDSSLSQAKAVNSIFSIEDGVLGGALNFFGDNAASYRDKYREQTEGYSRATVLISHPDTLIVSLQPLPETDLLPLLKTLFLDMDSVDYAAAVSHGVNEPFQNFDVGENPNSIFVNYEFKDQQARNDFEAAHLPQGFSLAPISIIEGETPLYYLVLNIYQSGGDLVSGARAEWSVFVDDPYTGEPRFLVIQAAADSATADSVNMLVLKPDLITHELTPTAIESCYDVADCTDTEATPGFASSINWPQVPQTLTSLDREFVVANDYIFWGNGVADRALYNSTQFHRDVVMVDPAQSSYTDNTEWAAYVNAAPAHALVYLNPLEIVVSPWWNLDETYLDAILEAPDANPTRTQLLNFKNSFYPGLVQGNAKAAIQGVGRALASTTISDSVPTARYHFPLLDANGLLTDIAGPGVHTPIVVTPFEGEAAGNYVTLNVYKRETDTCGIRAEWVTYVAGTDGRPETLRIDSVASEPCLDPVSLMTLAADVTQQHNLVSNDLETSINTAFVQFDASIDLDATTGVQVGLDWLESGDRVCSLNAVCDEFYVEGQHVMEPAHRAGAGDITITMATPWDSYINTADVRAAVRLVPALQAYNPWRTMRSFAAPAP